MSSGKARGSPLSPNCGVRPPASSPGAARLIAGFVFTMVIVLAGGLAAFFLVHPKGKAIFENFLKSQTEKPPDVASTHREPRERSERDEGDQGPPGVTTRPAPSPPAPVEHPVPAATPDPLLAEARSALDAGRLDEAEQAARTALGARPEDEGPSRILAEIEARRRSSAKAAHDTALQAAREFLAKEDLVAARTWADRALAAMPSSEEAVAVRDGILVEVRSDLERRGDAEEAASRRRAQEELLRKRASDLTAEGWRLLEAGDTEGAAERARKALALDPVSISAHGLKARAEERRRVAGGVSRAAQGHYEVGERCRLAGDLEGAETFAKKALEADPTHREARALLEAVIAAKSAREAERRGRGTADPELARRLEEAERKLRELERLRAARPGVLETPPGGTEPADGLGPVSLGPRGPISIEPPGAPISIEGEAGVSTEEPGGAVSTRVRPEPSGPIILAPDAEPPGGREPAGPVSIEGPGEARVQVARAVLSELDRAIRDGNVAALGRLLSEEASGVISPAGASGREGELANAREFFKLADSIRIERTTRPEDVTGDQMEIEARSSFRISYRILGQEIPRSYRARYSIVRERGAWRLKSVRIEEEGP